MDYNEISELIDFTSHILFLFVSFMCGMFIGYIKGRLDERDGL